MPTLSSQSTISSLPLPQKSAAFFKNPLDRPEIGPAENHPLVQPQPIIPTSAFEKPRLPSLWKPEKSAVTPIPATHPQPRPQAPVVAQHKNALAETPTRRRLPDEIKKIFETNSKDFAAYVKKGNKGDDKNSALSTEKIPEEMDGWDRALLLGEGAPTAAIPHTASPKRLSFSPTQPSSVPQKTDAFQSGTAFPSRVMDEEVTSPHPQVEVPKITLPSTPSTPLVHTKPAATFSVPKKPQDTPKATPIRPETRALPVVKIVNNKTATPAIPVKPKQPTINTVPLKNVLPLSVPTKTPATPAQAIPKKYPQQTSEASPMNTGTVTQPTIVPTPNMSETLVEKIIEGQMRGVFENAPPLLQKKLEKTIVREIFSATDEKDSKENIENEVWKKRLREYLTKLQGQAQSVFPDTTIANPIEGELVLDYVKRIYPILLKAQIVKQ